MPEGAPTASVRMYRQGFGDCFLVRLMQGAAVSHVLIDCGVHDQSPDRAQRMSRIVEDIQRETGGKLAVLIATHEHVDHVSAFEKGEQQQLFSQFQIDQVWLGWTENPTDKVAQKLKRELVKSLALVERAARAPSISKGLREDLQILSGFSFKAGKSGTASAMAWLRGFDPKYLRPFQQPLSVPGIPGVRVYVLGPPRDVTAIRSKDPRKNEGYARLAVQSSLRGLAAAAEFEPESDDVVDDSWTPFDERHLPRPTAEDVAARERVRALYESPENAWRRIDGSWENALPELALRVGTYINNTSLVLAFELGEGGDVLLFAGDAQAGNCRSWSEGEFDVNGRKVTCEDLLSRTVLYKVSHHASHNGTLKAQGLELMTSPKLTAMIPLMRRPLGERWHMPAKGLINRLRELCDNRVLISDFESDPLKPPTPASRAWKKFARDQVVANPDWVEWKPA